MSKIHQKTKDIFTSSIPYLENGYKPAQIDKILKLPKRSVSKAMKTMGHKWSEYHGGNTYKNKEWLSKKYQELQSAEKIGKLIGEKAKTITWWRKKLGIPKIDTSQFARKYYINQEYFSKIDNQKKAYWLGFLMADGCVINKKGNKMLMLGLSIKDKKHIEKMLNDMDANYPINIGESKSPTGKYFKNASVTITCKKLCDDLNDYCVNENKTFNSEIPKNINHKYIRHFIRGFFDGDGCIVRQNKNDNNLSFSLSSASKKILLDIANYFESTLSIKHYQVKKINRSIYKHDFFSYQVCAIEYNKKIFKHLYNYSSVYLDRKKEKIKDFIKTPCSQNKCVKN